MRTPLLLLTLALCIPALLTRGADWPQFRGADRSGVSVDPGAPVEWSADKNVKWKVALPSGGNSSPVVWGERVFLTCAQDAKGTRRSVYCFNRADGKELWVKTVPWEEQDPHHAANPYCASTPAVDGKHVVVWHGSAGLYCYDYEGNELWKRDLGRFRHIWGYAGSPVIHGDRVFLNCGPGKRQFVTAIDVATGNPLWQTDEPGGFEDKSTETNSWIGSWTTPVVAKIDGQEQVLVAQPQHVNAYDPATGKILWFVSGTGDLAYADVMVNTELNIGVAMAGYGGKAMGFRLGGGTGDLTATNRLWQNTDKPPQRIGTGVFVGKELFIVQEPGFACMDPMTGKFLWQHREPGQVLWASLVKSGDRLYVTSQKGTTFVFAADPKEYRMLAKNEVGEKSNSTIAVTDSQIFLRTYGHLYCIEGK
jgi:outer membrane protein assembly factor BamB